MTGRGLTAIGTVMGANAFPGVRPVSYMPTRALLMNACTMLTGSFKANRLHRRIQRSPGQGGMEDMILQAQLVRTSKASGLHLGGVRGEGGYVPMYIHTSKYTYSSTTSRSTFSSCSFV